jgi:RNA polymerase sigma factor (sigma-70 family)
MIYYSDEDILRGLKVQDRSVVNYVYKELFPTIKYLITTNSGSEIDAEDVFQDALVIIFKKVRSDDLVLTSSFKTYLYSVCRNLWLQRLDKKAFSSEFLELENLNELQDTIQFEFADTENEKYKLFQQHFLNLGEDCQKVLKLFLQKVPLKEIADIMGFKSEKYAKTRKFMCKEKLKQQILNDPRFKKLMEE